MKDPKFLRGDLLALRKDIAPGGTGNSRVCRQFAWLGLVFSPMHGIFVAGSIVS